MSSATAPAYCGPPAIVRKQRAAHTQAQGSDGRFLEEYMLEIQRALAHSQEWQSIIDSMTDEDESAEDESFSVSSLEIIPPKRIYTAHATFYFAGRGEPMPYDFGDMFADEETGE